MSAKEFVKTIYPKAYVADCWNGQMSIMEDADDEWHYISGVFRFESFAWEDAAARLRNKMLEILES